jgi:hypothetical protein
MGGRILAPNATIIFVLPYKDQITLDYHKGEVSANNIRSIIKQAGISRKEFHEACD